MEGLGGLVFILILGGLVILPLLLFPVFWLVGWRPGALVASLLLLLWSWGFDGSGTDIIVSNLLRLHIIPLAALLWEWRCLPQAVKIGTASLREVGFSDGFLQTLVGKSCSYLLRLRVWDGGRTGGVERPLSALLLEQWATRRGAGGQGGQERNAGVVG